MDLSNPIETTVHHLLIRGMVCLGCRDEFPVVSALVYVMHIRQDGEPWHKTINCHDSPSYYTAWTLIEMLLSLCQNQQEALTYGWNPKMVIYPYRLGHYWWKLMTIGILNRRTIISQGLKIVCPLRWFKGHIWSWNLWPQ